MQTQRHLRIFISSTFQDMYEEREVLLKNTFLELKKIAKSRDVEITEIDLRTGITKEQAESGEIIKICLDEVERCADSPIFFLGMLGNRYGSVDWLSDVSNNILEDNKYNWITNFSNRSITEIEIISALERDKKHNRAFFYLKEGEDDNPKLTNLKNKLIDKLKTNNNIVVAHYKNISEFREQTIKSFTKALDELYPKDKKISEVEKLRNSHQIFAKSRQKIYIPHAKNEAVLSNFLSSEQDRLLLYGESGYGKSALLANYFGKFKENNDSFIIEHYIGGAGELSNDLHQMLRRIMLEIKEEFNLPQEVPTEPQKIMDEFAQWLYNVKRPTIIILDGYNQIEDELKEKLFHYILEKLEKVKLIISSIKDNYPIDNKYKIEPLSKEEKQELIIDYLTHYGKEGMALKIYTQITTHPQTDNTLFLRTLLNEIRLLGNFDNIENDINNYLQAKDVVELFIKIFERLESDYRTNLAREVLSLLYVSRDGLSEDNLMEIINHNSTQELSRLEFSPLFLALEEHLINKNGLYGFFHDYICEAVKNRYLNSLELINRERRKIADYFESREIDNQRVRELPFHLYNLKDRDRLYHNLVDIDFFVIIQELDEYMMIKYMQYLNKVYDIADKIKELSLENKYSNHNNIYKIAYFFHHIYDEYQKSLDLFQKAIKIQENILGKENIDVAKSMDALASLYETIGDYSNAEFYYKKSIEISTKTLGKNNPNTITTINNLAGTYYYQEEYKKALSYYEQSLSILESSLGENHPSTTANYNNLSLVYKSIGKYENSLALSIKNLKIRKKTLGENHLDTAISMLNLAELYKIKKMYKKALPYYIKSFNIRKNILGEYNSKTLIALSGLAGIYKSIKKYKTALFFYQKSLDLSITILGKKHFRTITIMNNLAGLYYMMQDYNKSLSFYQKTLKNAKEVFGEDSPKTMITYNSMGLVYIKMKQYRNALPLYKKILGVRKKTIEINSSSLAETYNKLFIVSFYMQDYKNASIYLMEAISIWKNILPSNHSKLIDAEETFIKIEKLSKNNG